jgi:hypothetical protein
MNRTTVINVRGRDRAALLADPDFVYVGRAASRAGWHHSPFGNPFGGAAVRPEDAVKEYASRIEAAISATELGQREEPAFREIARWHRGEHAFWVAIVEALPSLRGKRLGCWCCDWDGTGEPPKPCHAVVLAKLADALGPQSPGPAPRGRGGEQ